jgi:hypothetical protein
VYPQDPLNPPEQLFTPSKAPFPSTSTASVPPFSSSSFNLLRRRVKNTRRNSEFSARRMLQSSAAKLDRENGVTASSELGDHFRRLRQVDLFKVDNAVKNVNFLRDDCLDVDTILPSAGLGRDVEGINREFETLISKEASHPGRPEQHGPSVMAELEHLRILNRSLRERNSVVEARMEYNRKLYQLHCRRIKDEVVKDLLVMFKLMYTEDGRVTWSKRDSIHGPIFSTDNIVKVMNEMMKALDVLEKVVKSM